MADEEQYLTVDEIAKMFRVSRMTIYRLVEDGSLRSVKIGRSVRIPASGLADYLRENSACTSE